MRQLQYLNHAKSTEGKPEPETKTLNTSPKE